MALLGPADSHGLDVPQGAGALHVAGLGMLGVFKVRMYERDEQT